MNGYIKLYRRIQENKFWYSEPFSKGQAWIDLLLMANHKDAVILIGNTSIVIKSGQVFTSIKKLANLWSWSRHKVSNFLTILEASGQIGTSKRTSKYTVITIANWAIYQNGQSKKDTTGDIKRTSKGHQKDTNNNVKKYKNNPPVILKNNITIPPFIKGELWTAYLEMRKKIRKPATERAQELCFIKLEQLKKKGEDPNEVLQQSIMQSWQGLFPVKDKGNGKALPSYNEDTHFLCRGCNQIKAKTEREGEYCRRCAEAKLQKQGEEFRRKWEGMNASDQEKHLARLKALKIKPQNWMIIKGGGR